MAIDKFSLDENSFKNVQTEDLDSDALDLFLSEDVQPIKKVIKMGEDEKAKTKEVFVENEDFDLENLKLEEDEDENEEDEPVKKIIEKEKKKKDEEESTEDAPEENETDEDNDSSVYSVLTRELVDLGIFSLNEGEQLIDIQSAEDFRDRFEVEQKKKAANTIDQFLSQFGDDYSEAFEAIFVNGVPPREYLSQVAEIEDVTTLDLADEINQRAVLKKHYKSLGWDDAKIENKIQKIDDYGDLESEAKDVHEILIKQEQKKLQKLEQDQITQRERKKQEKNQYDNSILNIVKSKLETKEFDSIPVDKNFAQTTLNFLTQEKYKTSSGEMLTEFDNFILSLRKPENWEKKVKLGMLINWMEKDPTFSKLQKNLISKESNTLFKDVVKHATKSKSQTSSKKSNITSFI